MASRPLRLFADLARAQIAWRRTGSAVQAASTALQEVQRRCRDALNSSAPLPAHLLPELNAAEQALNAAEVADAHAHREFLLALDAMAGLDVERLLEEAGPLGSC